MVIGRKRKKETKKERKKERKKEKEYEMSRGKKSDFEKIAVEGILKVRNENQAKTGEN